MSTKQYRHAYLSVGFYVILLYLVRSGSAGEVWRSTLARTWVTSFQRKHHTLGTRPWPTACGQQKSGWMNTKTCTTIATPMPVWYAYLYSLLYNLAFVCLSAHFPRQRLSQVNLRDSCAAV